ncbi:hypothetical protein [Thermoactinospora rubra]|uniref:hypothetical protein n=1 Tax=Thermoactinospora rubra TaxID=1088767 RepID=UPI00117DA342|nr:hypothetical protein [Thermoactinospora rubra]
MYGDAFGLPVVFLVVGHLHRLAQVVPGRPAGPAPQEVAVFAGQQGRGFRRELLGAFELLFSRVWELRRTHEVEQRDAVDENLLAVVAQLELDFLHSAS